MFAFATKLASNSRAKTWRIEHHVKRSEAPVVDGRMRDVNAVNDIIR